MAIGSPLGANSNILNATGTRKGIIDGSNAAAGCIGEILSASGSSVAVTGNTNIVLCSIAFTPGLWKLYGNVVWDAATLTTPVQFLVFYGTAAGDNQTGIDSVGGAAVDAIGPTTATGKNQLLPIKVYNFTTPTTIYLKAFCDLASGSPVADAVFYGERMAVTQ